MTTDDDNGNGGKWLKSRPLLLGGATALITALVTTSFNDYLVFREQDTIHRLRIDQLRMEAKTRGSAMREVMQTAIEEGRRENIRLMNEMNERTASFRREAEQIRTMISSNTITFNDYIAILVKHKDDSIQRLSVLEAKIKTLEECPK